MLRKSKGVKFEDNAVVENRNYPCARYLRAQYSRRVLLLFTFLWLFCHASRVSSRFFAGIKVARGWEMLKLLVNVGIRVTARKTLQRRRISSDGPQRSFRVQRSHRPAFSWSLFARFSHVASHLSRHIASYSFSSSWLTSQWRSLLNSSTNEIRSVQSFVSEARWKLRWWRIRLSDSN